MPEFYLQYILATSFIILTTFRFVMKIGILWYFVGPRYKPERPNSQGVCTRYGHHNTEWCLVRVGWGGVRGRSKGGYNYIYNTRYTLRPPYSGNRCTFRNVFRDKTLIAAVFWCLVYVENVIRGKSWVSNDYKRKSLFYLRRPLLSRSWSGSILSTSSETSYLCFILPLNLRFDLTNGPSKLN